MILKVRRHKLASDFIIYDNIESVNFGHRIKYSKNHPGVYGSIEPDLDNHPEGTTNYFCLSRVWDSGGDIHELTYDENVDKLYRVKDYEHDPHLNDGEAVYFNWVEFKTKDGKQKLVVFDSEGYLCNDEGKTIEVIR